MELESIINSVEKSLDYHKENPVISLSRYAHKMLPSDLKKAEQIYDYILNNYSVSLYETELTCLKNMIVERKQYQRLSDEQKKQYQLFKEKGKQLYEEQDFSGAYDYYLAGLYLTNHNIFRYYIGKTLYKSGYFCESYSYFASYINKGGEKRSKALLYLCNINKKNKRYKRINDIIEELFKLNAFFDYHLDFLDRYLFYLEKDYKDLWENYKNDDSSRSASDVSMQLDNIKNLICQHQDNRAEKLLKELEKKQSTMSKDDKNLIMQFRKNKKLYRAKR